MDNVHVSVDLGTHCARARHRAQQASRAVLVRSLYFLDSVGMSLNADKSHAWATVTGVRSLAPKGFVFRKGNRRVVVGWADWFRDVGADFRGGCAEAPPWRISGPSS